MARETRPRSPPLRSPIRPVVSHRGKKGEEEGGQDVSDSGVGQVRVGVLKLVEEGLFHVEYLMVLVVVADVDSGAQGDLAGVRREHLVDDL